MKKLLLVLAIGAFAACGDGATDDTETGADTMSTSTVDSTTVMPADTSATMSDTSAVGADSAAAR